MYSLLWWLRRTFAVSFSREIRECLKLDPDHKECFPFYKKVKKLVKQMGQAQQLKNDRQWDECVSKANNMLKTEGSMWHYVLTAKSHICHCQAQVCITLLTYVLRFNKTVLLFGVVLSNSEKQRCDNSKHRIWIARLLRPSSTSHCLVIHLVQMVIFLAL